MNDRIANLLANLTFEEKADLVTGLDMWHTRPVERLNIGSMKVTDGPNGARGDGLMGTGVPTACIPSGAALGATWDPDLVEELGQLLGDESLAKSAHVLLAPTINLHRSPLGGRNFECYSEDPFLTGRIATGFVKGVQSRGVATTPKHFVGNDSEFERNTIDVQIDERTIRELYLLPFEMAVKDGDAWGIMSAYNRLDGTFCSNHEWLLKTVLRDEWGFDGFVVSDWFAARATAGSVKAGLSLEMPGQGNFYGREKLGEARDNGEIVEADLDVLVLDVLKTLERTGVLDGVSADGKERTLDRPEDRALVRRAGAAATVLLTNNGVLPLDESKLKSIALIGPNALAAKVMGGGSAGVATYRAVSPVEAFRDRLRDRVDVTFEPGCNIDRSTPPLGAPLLTSDDVTIEYVIGHDLSAPTVLTRSQSFFKFLIFGPLAEGIEPDKFAFRATGSITPTASGTHSVRLVQCGRARVLLDGKVVIDATAGDIPNGDEFFGFGSIELAADVELTEGQTAEVVVEYTNQDAILLAGATVGIVSMVEEDLMGRAVAAARAADIAVVVVGTNDDWETEGRDREIFELPGDQPELIRQVAAVNDRTIVVVNTGGIVDLSWLDEPAAVLQVGFGGQEMGHGLADVIFGDADPGGRLPTTVPARFEHHPALPNYPGENSVVRYGEGLFMGYRWFDSRYIEPALPFGHGLSYSTFEISEPTCVSEIAAGESVEITVRVTNTGIRAGSEVVQLFVEPHQPRLIRPLRELKAFAKVHLATGESTTVTLALTARSFAVWDTADAEFDKLSSMSPVPSGAGAERRAEAGWWVDAGLYTLCVGRSSRELVHRSDITITGEAVLLSR